MENYFLTKYFYYFLKNARSLKMLFLARQKNKLPDLPPSDSEDSEYQSEDDFSSHSLSPTPSISKSMEEIGALLDGSLEISKFT